jgi:hypothetical protein
MDCATEVEAPNSGIRMAALKEGSVRASNIQYLAVGLLVFASLGYAQHRVDSQNTYSRVICVVPLVGSGTPADPKRPQYAPWPLSRSRSRTDILAYSHQISDDGRFALVEFVARDRRAFLAIFNDKTLKVFEKGKDKKDDIEKELKNFKKDFDLNQFATRVP